MSDPQLNMENIPILIENAMLKCYAKERDDLATVATNVADILSRVTAATLAIQDMKVNFGASLKNLEEKVATQNGRIVKLERMHAILIGAGTILMILEPIALKFYFK